MHTRIFPAGRGSRRLLEYFSRKYSLLSGLYRRVRAYKGVGQRSRVIRQQIDVIVFAIWNIIFRECFADVLTDA
jgi:hypothetical protein